MVLGTQPRNYAGLTSDLPIELQAQARFKGHKREESGKIFVLLTMESQHWEVTIYFLCFNNIITMIIW